MLHEMTVAQPFTEDAGGRVEGWLGWVVGHDMQPHMARVEQARA